MNYVFCYIDAFERKKVYRFSKKDFFFIISSFVAPVKYQSGAYRAAGRVPKKGSTL